SPRSTLFPYTTLFRSRYPGIDWGSVESRLQLNPEKLWSLYQMEETGGEPDVISFDEKTGEFMFYDCSKESPKGRRSVCYDREGRSEEHTSELQSRENL